MLSRKLQSDMTNVGPFGLRESLFSPINYSDHPRLRFTIYGSVLGLNFVRSLLRAVDNKTCLHVH
jgi:hypothetical protein